MGASPVKLAVLALTASAAEDLPDWRYLPTGVRFVRPPCPGGTVTLGPLWTFKGWYAITQHYVDVESTSVTKAFVSVFGRKPSRPLIILLYPRSLKKHRFWGHFAARISSAVTDD